ncbi:hypothetical protein CEUSTIGMA_g4782.t1 [Chlamydomonas eustigma]|uniref:AAA+ ATPase domain-containing protein n=1 Tax=Chlamydomonas eustigma TaxID=1157962 RepID=A0A250X2Q5_9CHLO|nr:hypothetical protein CEUSTIGMA_g4782.t1 [Chlamydomonas eustigma]|eukprot:GAX77336.1 hypothetical protein CEUSTIGMA_g4782.t1 [Chlamydomonas eustigma]
MSRCDSLRISRAWGQLLPLCRTNSLWIHTNTCAKEIEDSISDPKETSTSRRSRNLSKSALSQFGHDLTEDARLGLLDPCIGRQDVIQRALQVLLRRSKNNPILTGEAGVGKTAIVEGVAQLLITPLAPPGLQRRRVISLDLTALISGSTYRGEFEERLHQIVKEVQAAKGSIILFIDEIHQLVGAGASEGALSAANILKPSLARGNLQCIGATTLDEYRENFEKDPALARRFQPVLVEEPSVQDSLTLLQGLAPRYETFHGVTFTREALKSAVEGAARYIPDRRLPDSAIDVIDEAASRVVLLNSAACGSISLHQRPTTRGAGADRANEHLYTAGHDEDHSLRGSLTQQEEFSHHSQEANGTFQERLVQFAQQTGQVSRGSASFPSSSWLKIHHDTTADPHVPMQQVQQSEVHCSNHSSNRFNEPPTYVHPMQFNGSSSPAASCANHNTHTGSPAIPSACISGKIQSPHVHTPAPDISQLLHPSHLDPPVSAASAGRSDLDPPVSAGGSDGSVASAIQDWDGWVSSQGWWGSQEARRQQLLHWFGATPSEPQPGPAGHRQTTEERLRVSLAMNGRGMHRNDPQCSLKNAGEGAWAPQSINSRGRTIEERPCPHCGTLVQASPVMLRLRCPSCSTRFLNMAPEKLQIGASLLLNSSTSAFPLKPPPSPPLYCSQSAVASTSSSSSSSSVPVPHAVAARVSTAHQFHSQIHRTKTESPPLESMFTLEDAKAQSAFETLQQVAETPNEGRRPLVVEEQDVLDVMATLSGVPAARLSKHSQLKALQRLEIELGNVVKGQSEAVKSDIRKNALGQVICLGIRAWRLGLSDFSSSLNSHHRQSSRAGLSLVLSGPEGVGKTTACQEIARFLFPDSHLDARSGQVHSSGRGHMLRLQMSEYAERSSISRLIGAPPGYIGHGRGGLLTSALRLRPGQVVVFEDVDKAHPEVVEILQKVVEEGQLTDSDGKTASFRNAVVIFSLSCKSHGQMAGIESQKFVSSSQSCWNAAHQKIKGVANDSDGVKSFIYNSVTSQTAAAHLRSEATATEAMAIDSASSQQTAGIKGYSFGGALSSATNSTSPTLQGLMAAVDVVVPFSHMSSDAGMEVVEMQLAQLRDQVQMMYHQVSEVTWTHDVVRLLSEQGRSSTHGLKPLVGIIRQHILAPIAESLSLHAYPVYTSHSGGDNEETSRDFKCAFSIELKDNDSLIVNLVPHF